MRFFRPKFPATLTVTKDHIKLLKRMNIDWDDAEYGAPSIDPKRPYGNSSVEGGIFKILDWATGPDGLTDDECERARKIHEEMATVLQILCDNADDGVKVGKYARVGSRYWKVDETKSIIEYGRKEAKDRLSHLEALDELTRLSQEMGGYDELKGEKK